MFRRAALVWTLGLPLASAEEGASPPAVAQTPANFASGFKQLQALGLPSLEGGEWFAADTQSSGGEDYPLRELLTLTKGTGWRLKIDGKEMFLPLGSVETIEMPDTGGGSQNRSLLGSLFGGGSKKPKGADLSKDVASLTAALNDPEKSKELRKRMEYSSGSQPLGRLLIFAAQLHQSGHPAEANQLAAAVFAMGAPPEAIIDNAINRLAVRDHTRISASFFATHDWAAYEQGLRGLITRYPRGWDNFAAVQMLLPAVAKRVANTPAPKPAIDGITLNPDALAALDEIFQGNRSAPDDDAIKRFATENGIPASALNAEMRERIVEALSNQSDRRSNDMWLIQDSSGKGSSDPTARLKGLGIEALPVLAAVAPDETLTILPNSRGSSYHSYRSSNDSPAELAIKAYQTLERPKSRGEIASQILRSTLPGDQDESSPEVLADTAVTFWKANRGKSKLDLLKIFLAEGNSAQKSSAAATLAAMTDEASRKAFEAHVLESEEPAVLLEAVASYIKLHKGGAKDFFTKFSEKLKAQPEGDGSDPFADRSEIRRSKEIDKYLKTLSVMVGGESPQKLLLEIAKAEKPDLRQIAGVLETLEKTPKDEVIAMFLDAAGIAKSPDARTVFLSSIARMSMIWMRSARTEGENQEAPLTQTDIPIPAALAPKWTVLMADDRVGKSREPVKLHTAGLLEQLYSPGTLELLQPIYYLDAASYRQLVLARAQERLEGKPLTPIPDGSKIPAARIEELLNGLSSAKPEAASTAIQAWKIEDKVGYANWRAEEGNLEKIPASVVAARRVILPPEPNATGLSAVGVSAILQSLNLKPGAIIEANPILTLAAKLATEAKQHSGLSFHAAENSLASGLIVDAQRYFDPLPEGQTRPRSNPLEDANSTLEDTDKDAVVVISWGPTENSEETSAVWSLIGTNVEPPPAETLQKFRTGLAAPSDSDSSDFSIIINVLHRDDIEKLKSIQQSVNEGSDENEE